MAEVVDSIIAELIVRDNGYVANFDKATAAHERFTKSMPKVAGGLDLSGAEAQKYANRHKKAASEVAAAEEATTAKVTRTRKARADAAVASDEKEVRSAKAAARAKADVEIAEAERSARYRRLAEQAASNRAIPQSTSGRIGATVANEASGQRPIPAAVMAGGQAEQIAAETEVNHLLADRFDLALRARSAEGMVKRELQDQVDWLRRINTYKAAGLTEDQAILRAESETLAVEKLRAIAAEKQAAKGTTRGVEQFARGAGAYAALGGGPAIAGLALTAGVALGAEAISKATEYARALQDVAKEAGLTTTALQVYQHAAAQDGVTQEQLSAGLRLFSENLGKARTGSEEQIKVFRALGINIHTAATAGELLPTLVNRISSIPDQAKRARVELALFGESGAKLDGMLSGGNERLDKLSDALQKNNAILSATDIAKLDEISKKLAEAKAVLMTDISSVVAHNASAILTLVEVFEKVAGAVTTAVNALARFNRYAAIGAKQSLGLPVDQDIKNLALDNQEDRISGIQKGLGLDSKFASPQPGGVNTKLLNSLGFPKGPKGKSASQIEAERLERDRKFTAEEEREQQARLSYLSELTSDTRDQDEYARQRVEIERVARDRELKDDAAKTIASQKLKGAEAAQVNAHRDTLIALNDRNAQLQLDAINRKETSRYLEEEAAHLQTAAETQTDILNSQLALATTAKERREIELRLLAIATEQERVSLQKLIDDKATTPAAREDAQARLGALPGKAAGQAAEINRRDAGPWQQYLQSLPHTADQIGEAFEKAAVNGVERLNDSLGTALSKLLGLHGAAGQFLEDLIQIGIQAAESAIFGGSPGGGPSSAGSGGLISGLGPLLGFASGGSMTVGGNPGIDRNILSLNGRPIARVSQREVLSVSPNVSASNARIASPSAAGVVVHQNFVLDARFGITTPELLNHVNAVASQRAAEAGQASYRASVASVPTAMSRYQSERG